MSLKNEKGRVGCDEEEMKKTSYVRIKDFNS